MIALRHPIVSLTICLVLLLAFAGTRSAAGQGTIPEGLTTYTSQYSYDGQGRLTEAAHTVGYSLTYQYDAGGNVLGAATGDPLPVELVRFEARRDGEAVRLSWQTASETNSRGFEVQRAVRPAAVVETRHVASLPWTEIAFVEGAGTTTEAHSYRYVDEDVPFAADTLHYRLKQVDFDGTFAYGPEVEVAVDVPQSFALHGNFPNPFTAATTIRYELPEARRVRLSVFDVLGRHVATLVDDEQPAGRYRTRFDGALLPPGVYLYRLQAGDFTAFRRMVLAR